MSVYKKEVISFRNNHHLKKKKRDFENTTFHSYLVIDVHLMLCKNLMEEANGMWILHMQLWAKLQH